MPTSVAAEPCRWDTGRAGSMRLEASPARCERTSDSRQSSCEGEDLHAVVGSDEFAYGVVSNLAAAVDPAKYTFGLAEAVARRGVPIVEQCEVRGLYPSGATYFVATAKGTIRAGDVLVATNGYTPEDLVPDSSAPDRSDRLLHGRHGSPSARCA